MTNAFEKMCKELDEIKPCGCSMCVASNEYVCAYNAVKAYVGKDRNKLLKLKAEAESGDYNEFFSKIFTLLSFLIAAFALIITIFFEIFKNSESFKVIYGMTMLLVLVVVCIYIRVRIKKFNNVPKWRGYIRVAIEELEKPNNPDNPENLSKNNNYITHQYSVRIKMGIFMP